MNLQLTAPGKMAEGLISLEGSKSISNRLLVMRALATQSFDISNLSPSDDTKTLNQLLNNTVEVNNVGAAGTTMRFLTAYFAATGGGKILTGSERMKKRPIKILVDALREIGAEIEYQEVEGFPPIHILEKKISGGEISIRADVSSQYLSSLCIIAPALEGGLTLLMQGKISSWPYLLMTLKLMQTLGIKYIIKGNEITIDEGTYKSKNMVVESDWSAASYYFSICALSKNSTIHIHGLFPTSLQGDSVLPEIYKHISVDSFFHGDILTLKNTGTHTAYFEYDFSDCPDLAQTVVVSCAALGISGSFKGLESLKIKETDRTHALHIELQKFGVKFYEQDGAWKLEGKTFSNSETLIHTYEDHRMAMSFAPLSIVHPHLVIEDADVVKKSYPSFWNDLISLGFVVSYSG